MSIAKKLGLLTGLAGLLAAGPAFAQVVEEEPPPYEEPLAEPTAEQRMGLFSGVGVSVGGGVAGFTDDDMRDFTEVGGAWEARATFNTRGLLGVEAAYVGTANGIDAIGLDSDAILLGTTIEGNARLNFLPGEQFTPYVLGGIGWTRYDIVNESFNTSSIRDDDNQLSVPLGGGVSYRYDNLLVDVRGTYRASFRDDLIPATAAAGEDVTQDSWSATARVGFEF